MQVPASHNASSSPAPLIQTKKVELKYEDIRYAARTSVLQDFVRERRYWLHRRQLKETGSDIEIIEVPQSSSSKDLVRSSRTWLLKEHQSASWAASMYQFSIYGLTGITAVGTAMSAYLGLYHSRMFLMVTPFCAVTTWRLWAALENAWAQQKYLENAAIIREERKGNPMQSVVKRRRVARDSAQQEHDEGDVDESMLS